jgi:metal transporter CNNM
LTGSNPEAKMREGVYSTLPEITTFQFLVMRVTLVGFLLLIALSSAEEDDCGGGDDGDGAPINVLDLTFTGALLLLSGLFSGLCLSLMSLSYNDLEVIVNGSDDEVKVRHAKTIMPLRKRGNLLLCTLLVGNTFVNVLLANLLADMTSGFIGSTLATLLMCILGKSFCSRYALRIGAAAIPIVWCFVGITFVLSFPISLLLDFLLGREMSSVYSKHELMALFKLHVDTILHRQESGLTEADGKMLTVRSRDESWLLSSVFFKCESRFEIKRDTTLDITLHVLKHNYLKTCIFKI